MKSTIIALAAVAVTTFGTGALAHASLEQQKADVGSFYKGVMRIGHGCNKQATLKVRIAVPEGVISVKPMPKPGWAVETVVGEYENSYDYYGQSLNEGVKEIIWTGQLEDAHYDEFVFRAKLHSTLEPEQTLYFATIQECADGENTWVEIPVDGQNSHDLKKPAPGLFLTNPSGHSH